MFKFKGVFYILLEIDDNREYKLLGIVWYTLVQPKVYQFIIQEVYSA